jgi:hypothetical protein
LINICLSPPFRGARGGLSKKAVRFYSGGFFVFGTKFVIHNEQRPKEGDVKEHPYKKWIVKQYSNIL